MTVHRYHPFFCEENAWWLCQDEAMPSSTHVVFITNAARRCLLLRQRAVADGEPVLWDYHVIVIANGQVWDLDTRLAMPTPLAHYLDATFPPLPGELQQLAPRFRVVPRDELLATFCTDRSHMRDEAGGWLKPPPAWDPPALDGPANQMRFVDLEDPIAGTIVDLSELRAVYSK